MANVFIEESTMTEIGNAIRAKTGKTAKILPANMPSEIASIVAGGGLPSGVSKMTSGTFTQTANKTSNLFVNHDLGTTPNFLFWWAEGDYSNGASGIAVFGASFLNILYSSATTKYNVHSWLKGFNSNGYQDETTYKMSSSAYFTNNELRLYCTSTFPIVAGVTYHWIAGVLENVG